MIIILSLIFAWIMGIVVGYMWGFSDAEHKSKDTVVYDDPKDKSRVKYYENDLRRCIKCNKLIYMGRTNLPDSKLCTCKTK